MFTLLRNEEIITRSDDSSVTLTNLRIGKEYTSWGYSHQQSIMLKHITSCENVFISYPIFLILGIISIVAGFFTMNNSGNYENGEGVFFVGGGLILGFIYWFTRRNATVIASPSTKIHIPISGGGKETALEFINKVEAAIIDEQNKTFFVNHVNGISQSLVES